MTASEHLDVSSLDDARRVAAEANAYASLIDCGFTDEQAWALARTKTTVFFAPIGVGA